jgi:acyl-CoA thioesterase
VPKKFPLNAEGFHPFAQLIGLKFTACKKGYSECVLEINAKLLNPHRVVHGGVVYSMADTGMGAALYPHLDKDEICATVEIKIAYFAALASGLLTCKTKVIHKGKRIAVLESEIEGNRRLIAKAIGTYSIFKTKGD